MGLLAMAIVAVLLGTPLSISPNHAQDAPPLGAEVFADRSILLPQASYPLVALAHDSKGQIYALAFDQVVKLGQKGDFLKRITLRGRHETLTHYICLTYEP
jgi:hypothetical protein